jgi:two-component system, chemotaxis family, chemotaxis protein CheY
VIATSAIRVMIVDDKGMMRSLTARCLERLGFTQIFHAANPVEALPVARAERVHLIISDYHMPEMSGLEFLAAVRRDSVLSRVGFIMLTGSGDSDVVRRAEQLGASSYIMKPFSQNDLQAHISALFGELTRSRGNVDRRRSPAHMIAI